MSGIQCDRMLSNWEKRFSRLFFLVADLTWFSLLTLAMILGLGVSGSSMTLASFGIFFLHLMHALKSGPMQAQFLQTTILPGLLLLFIFSIILFNCLGIFIVFLIISTNKKSLLCAIRLLKVN